MTAYQYAVQLLNQRYSSIMNSEDLESAVFAKYGNTQDVEDEVWDAWCDSGN